MFWVRADGEAPLNADYAEIAALLDLPAEDLSDPDLVRENVKIWMEANADYLMVLDNADDPELLQPFLPSMPTGHVLITSRAPDLQIVRVALPTELPVLSPDEAREFLLRRGQILDAEKAERVAAAALSEVLGFLPLALEQAAAYVKVQEITYQEYLRDYRRLRLQLLEEQGPVAGDYPETVRTTWQTSFGRVRLMSPAAAELLLVSAFFASGRIPYELLVRGATELGETLATAMVGAAEDSRPLRSMLTLLRRYSLVRRNAKDHSYDIHRLVQEVLREQMGVLERRTWMERAVCAVSTAFPGGEFTTWDLCDRLLPHALQCFHWIEAECLEMEASGRLLNQTAAYLGELGQYTEAEPLHQRALAIREKALGSHHPDTAASLNNLAVLYQDQGKLDEAEPLCREALAIRENALGPNHPDTARSLCNLASLYNERGNLSDAERLYRRALEIFEGALGPCHPDATASLNRLASLYRAQGKLSEAEPLYQRALRTDERVHGPDHPHTAESLHNLGLVCWQQRKLAEAETFFQRALWIQEKAVGPDHPHTAVVLDSLARLYQSQGKLTQAEPFSRRTALLWEQVLGPDHPRTVTSLCNLAVLHYTRGNLVEAEPLFHRVLSTWERVRGPDHADTAITLNNLAALYTKQERWREAKPFAERAVTIFERVVGREHPRTRAARRLYAAVQVKLNRMTA